MTAVLRYDAACQAIAEANTVDEVSTWIDKAAAVKEYGRRIKNRQIEIDAIEIRVKAKRRRGEILAELKASGRLVSPRTAARKIESSEDDLISLEDLGVSRNESSEDQRLAAIPGDSFERLVARCRAHALAHPEKHSFDVLGENAATDKKAARETRERILGGIQLALPDKKFGVILADPEWRFKTYSRETGMDRAADNHYPTTETDDICARPVGDIAADDCVLFLWATAPMLPDALRVMAAWGFAYKSHCIWKKDRIGTGYWFRNQHELLLIGTRGKIPAPAMGTQSASVIDAPLGKHSEKPDCFYELIEGYFPTLPKIELNARRARAGWEAWGKEAPAAELPPHDPDTGEVLEADQVATPSIPAAPEPDPPADLCDIKRDLAARLAAEADRLLSEIGSQAKPDRETHLSEPCESASGIDTPGVGPSVAGARTATSEAMDVTAGETATLSEFEQLKAVADFCYPGRAKILPAIFPALREAGLARSIAGGKDWQLSDAGVRRLAEIPTPAAPAKPDHSKTFEAVLGAETFAQWRALSAVRGGLVLDRELARGLIGEDHVAVILDDKLALTEAGAKLLRSIELFVERSERVAGRSVGIALDPPAPKQIDLVEALMPAAEPIDLPLFIVGGAP